jgi:hypothetical protein
VAGFTIRKTEGKMTTMYLRNKKDGFIYGWNEILAKNPLCEAVTEEEAFPERFVNKVQVEKVRRRGSGLNLSTAEIPSPPMQTSAELSADASRGLPE